MTKEVYVGRQPILDKQKKIFAYELLFRNTKDNHAYVNSNIVATCAVINRVLTDMSIEEICGDKVCFINVDEEFLRSELVSFLPPRKTVLELLETMKYEEELFRVLSDLKSKGYGLALDDFEDNHFKFSPVSYVDYVKVDIKKIKSPQNLEQVVKTLRTFPLKLIAEKVEDAQELEICENLNFDYYQGYFFSKASVYKKRTLSPDQLMILELYRSLARDDDFPKIESTIKSSAELSYKFIKLANSPAFYTGEKIHSVGQAILKLGYRNLQKWCVLLLLSRDFSASRSDPLVERAIFRAKFMELLCSDIEKDKRKIDMAFLTGLFSILPIALNMPLKDLVIEFRLSDEIRTALIDKRGILGTLLQIVEKLEKESFEELKMLVTSVNLDMDRVFARETDAVLRSELFFQ
ncbi:MAG: EAL domain-containing protein [Deltaproteobacteria bacterium]|nr:EAL domain-containing protein [Deltaproteobacteria bacterium]